MPPRSRTRRTSRTCSLRRKQYCRSPCNWYTGRGCRNPGYKYKQRYPRIEGRRVMGPLMENGYYQPPRSRSRSRKVLAHFIGPLLEGQVRSHCRKAPANFIGPLLEGQERSRRRRRSKSGSKRRSKSRSSKRSKRRSYKR